MEKNNDYHYLIISTAHPAKFYQTMDMVNVPYLMPEKIKNLLEMKGRKREISTDYQQWKEVLINNSKKNITLIGMPISGKTTIGKELAKELNYNFIDLDQYIENKYQMKLSEIIEKFGNNEFKKIEEEKMLEMSGQNNIFSTGGSVVYSEKGMEYLKSISRVIFLNQDLDILKERMKEIDMQERGIVFEEGESYDTLFNERLPLYKKHSTEIINCQSLGVKEIVNKIV